MNDEKTGQIMNVESQLVPREGDIDPLALVERRNQIIEKLLSYAVGATHSGQWVDMGGKPFPTAPAAEVMARRCGVKVGSPTYTRETITDEKGSYYMYSCDLTACLPGHFDELTSTGTCTSRDQFFSRKRGEDVPQSEIDPGNIKKAAYSNALMNAVTKLLGVRNLSWDQLARCGIARSGMASVKYDGKDGERKAAAKTAEGQQAPEAAAKPAPAEVVIPFGKNQGKPLSEMEDRSLAWYLENSRKQAKEKPQFAAKEATFQAAIEAEQDRRSAKPPPPEPPPAGAPANTIPESEAGTVAGMCAEIGEVKSIVGLTGWADRHEAEIAALSEAARTTLAGAIEAATERITAFRERYSLANPKPAKPKEGLL